MPLTIPSGYTVAANGIFKEIYDSQGNVINTIPICYTNIEILSILTKIDADEVYYELSFDNKKIVLSGEELASRKGILKLAGYGVRVTEKHANDLSEYLTKLLVLNTFPVSNIYNSFGWKNDEYFLGDKLYSMTGTRPAVIHPKGSQTDAVVSCGNVIGWIDAVSKLMEYANQRFCMYIATSPMILKVLNEYNFNVNYWDESSKGKTTIIKASTSMYGNPDGLILSGDATKVGMERTAFQFCDMPVNLDDTQNQNKEMLSKIIYMVANGKGKLRGNKSFLDNVLAWRTVGMFTGETTITSDSSFGGLEARLIEKKGGIGATDIDAVNHYELNIKNNYGTFAPLLIQYILQNKNNIIDKHKEHRRLLKESIRTIADGAQKNIASRVSNTVATIMTAGYIFEEVYAINGGIKKNYSEVTINIFHNEILPSKKEVSYTVKGLNFIKDWVESNESYFLHDGERAVDNNLNEKQYKVLGNITVDYIDIIPKNLSEELKKVNLSVNRLMSDFKDINIIDVDGSGKTFQKSARIKTGGETIRVYRFKLPELYNYTLN